MKMTVIFKISNIVGQHRVHIQSVVVILNLQIIQVTSSDLLNFYHLQEFRCASAPPCGVLLNYTYPS